MGRVIRDIMKSKVVSVSADDTLWTVKEIMELGSVRHLPVVRKGELIGVVSQRDLLRASLSSVMGIEGSEHRVFLEQVRISDVMSSDPISISTGQSIRGAARIMAERKIGCLPVVDEGQLVGIVTETDLLRHFAALED
jgi:CBS domain-containing protein